MKGQWVLGLPMGLSVRVPWEGAGPGAPSCVLACLLARLLPPTGLRELLMAAAVV